MAQDQGVVRSVELPVVNLKEWIVILELHRQGLSISDIARRTGKDRKTVRKYIEGGVVSPPAYKSRPRRVSPLEPFKAFVRQRLLEWPELTGRRVMREIQALGYLGGYTTVKCFVRQVRPPATSGFEVRFETPAGHQAQVDFAEFKVSFASEPGISRRVWLFAMVLGHSRYLWAQFVAHQDLATVLRCHMEAFEHFGGVPREILYDRMKTAVLAEGDEAIIYNDKLLACGSHYRFTPRACKPYRAKTKGKIERPFRYIRADFFMARSFEDLADMNAQLRQWLDTVANARVHGTTQQVVSEHFCQEKPHLRSLPARRLDIVLRVQRRLTRDGFVSVDANLYSVPDGLSGRTVDVETTPTHVRIVHHGVLVAQHDLLTGRGERSLLAGHRRPRAPGCSPTSGQPIRLSPPGHSVAVRTLAVYEHVGRQLASGVHP